MRGESERFGELYDRYIRRIYTFIYYKTLHKETAEDLTSDTFIKALKNISSFDVERSFSSWLYKIAQNTVIDYYRTRKQTVDINDIWDLAADGDIEHDADVRLGLERVKEYLGRLPTLQRDIVIMRVWQNMSYREIAEVVGKSEESLRVTFSRAVAGLRKMAPVALLLVLFAKF